MFRVTRLCEIMDFYKEIRCTLINKTENAIDLIKILIESVNELITELRSLKEAETKLFALFGIGNADNDGVGIDVQISCLKKLKEKLIEEMENYNKALQEYNKYLDCFVSKIPSSSLPAHPLNISVDIHYCQAQNHENIASEIKTNSNSILNELSDIQNNSPLLTTEKLFESVGEYNQFASELSEIHTKIAKIIRDVADKYSQANCCVASRIVEKKEKKHEQSIPSTMQSDIIPPPKVDSVQFSAVAPEKAVAGKYFPINIFMYEEYFRKSIEDIVLSFGEKTKERKSGYRDVERNSMVKVILSSPDFTIEDDIEEQIWNGKYINFEFVVKIPSNFINEQILFIASIYVNDIIATKLKLIIECKGIPKHNIKITRTDVSSAFISYASQDRNRVATVIQGIKIARPDMDIFFDVESLRSGQKWEEILKNEIDNRDILFLCWSKAAKDSEWVDKEWRYALEKKGEEGIEPVPIDTPDICPPPPELQQKHFNDKLLYIIKSTPFSNDILF